MTLSAPAGALAADPPTTWIARALASSALAQPGWSETRRQAARAIPRLSLGVALERVDEWLWSTWALEVFARLSWPMDIANRDDAAALSEARRRNDRRNQIVGRVGELWRRRQAAAQDPLLVDEIDAELDALTGDCP